MDEARIQYLHDRYLRDALTPAEAEEWHALLREERLVPELRKQLDATWDSMRTDDRIPLREGRTGAIYQAIVSVPASKRLRRLRWLPYAAAILIAATAAALIFNDRQPTTPESGMALTEEIPAGGNRATLTIAGGRTIDLSEEQEGIVIQDGITYLDGSSVLADSKGTGTNKEMLTLTTPKGGTYSVTLPDGSNVWLNAATTLRYPSRFDDGQRVVFLDGEAYFDVAKSVEPFRVVSEGQFVNVLGTAFNLSAYADEHEERTTLVQGAVNVVSRSASKTTERLKPGERTTLSEHGSLTKTKADLAKEIAWKNGRISFTGVPFAKLMRQISMSYQREI